MNSPLAWFSSLFGNRKKRSVRARHEAALTNKANANHYQYADFMSARAAYHPQMRRTLRARSRYEEENNSVYSGVLDTVQNHIVGSGPSLQVHAENKQAARALESLWDQFAEAIGLSNLLAVMVRSDYRDGEVVGLRLDSGPLSWLPLGVRMYEADQLAQPYVAGMDLTVEDGIRLDTETGDPIAYHLLRQHPGDRFNASTFEGDWHSAENVIHMFRQIRPGQVRGVPRITPALEDLIRLRRWDIATLKAAENAALMAKTLSTSAAADDADDIEPWLELDLPDGGITVLPSSYKLDDNTPVFPSTNHEMFSRVEHTKIFRCINIPYPIAMGTSRDSNFSSATLDLRLNWVGEVRTQQRRCQTQAIQKLFRWFVDALACARYEYSWPLYYLPQGEKLICSWTWDPPPIVDPIDSASAAEARLSTGLSSLSEELSSMGKDPATSIERAAADLGLDVPTYQAMIRTKLFGAAAPDPATISPASQSQQGGEFSGLNRRQFQNNTKAITDILRQLGDGLITETYAAQILQTLGLSQQRADLLIRDQLDNGQVDDPSLLPMAASFDGTRSMQSRNGTRTLSAARRISRFICPVLMRIAAKEPGGRKFEILAYTGGPLRVSGFDLPVIVDLQGMDVPAPVPILLDHTPSVETTLGQATETVNTFADLTLKGIVTGQSQQCADVIAQADAGQQWQASIGAEVFEEEEIPAGQTVAVNGQVFDGPVIVARKSALRETSVLPTGADARTKVNLAAAAAAQLKGTIMGFEEWVKSLGLDPTTLTPEALAVLQQQYDALQSQQQAAPAGDGAAPPAAATAAAAATGVNLLAQQSQATSGQHLQAANDAQFAQALQAMRRQAADEVRRTAEMRRICAGYPTIEAAALEHGWSTDKAENAVLKEKLKPKAPAGHIAATLADASDTVIEAACCLSGKLDSVEKRFDEKTLHAADKLFKGGIRLEELFAIHARANGWTGRSYRADAKNMLIAAFSTTSLPGILSNVANKFLLEGFMSVEDAWRQIAAIRPVNDFKAATSYRLSGDFMYEKVGPGGELKHGTVNEETFTNKAETYGKLFGIARQDFYNDDMGALTAVPKRIGRGGHLKLNDVFWTEFHANHATFFNTDNSKKNYQEGSGTVLSIDSLTAAEAIFMDKTDPDGMPLAIEPKILLVPNALSTKATSLTRDLEIRDTTSNKQYTTSNPHAGKWRPVRSSYLGNANYGNSAVAWYLLADPQDLAMIEVCFLNGQETPTVEQADADFSTLGIQMRGYHDFGVAKQDYRAAVKSKGSA